MANYNSSYMPTPGWPQAPPATTAPMGTSYTTYPYGQAYSPTPPYVSQQMPQANYSYANSVNNKNIIWVAGQAGAEAYQMEPGSRAVLLDSKDQVFYIKVVGPDGRPEPLMAFKYEPLNLNMHSESSQSMQQPDMSNYATKEDLNEIKEYLQKMNSNTQTKRSSSNNG